MDAREVIARALVKRNYPNASEADLAEMVEGFMPDADAALSAFLAHLEASGRAIVPVEATYLGGHRLYCAALPPDNGTCTCGLAVRARLLGEG